MFGYPCELDELRAIAERHGLALIDDSAEALGAGVQGRDRRLARRLGGVRLLPQQADDDGRGRGGHDALGGARRCCCGRCATRAARTRAAGSTTSALGFNYRFTDLQAAVGIAQLEKLDEILSLRAAAAERYAELLAGVDGRRARRIPTTPTTGARGSSTSSSWRAASTATPCSHGLAAEGVEAGHYVPCVHLQPYMRERYGFAEGMCPVAEDAASRTLALPFYSRHRGRATRSASSRRCEPRSASRGRVCEDGAHGRAAPRHPAAKSLSGSALEHGPNGVHVNVLSGSRSPGRFRGAARAHA